MAKDLFQLQGSVTLETEAAQSEFKRGLRDMQRTAERTAVNLDTTPANAKLDSLRREMARITGVHPRVEIDTSAATAKVERLERQVDGLRRKSAGGGGGISGALSGLDAGLAAGRGGILSAADAALAGGGMGVAGTVGLAAGAAVGLGYAGVRGAQALYTGAVAPAIQQQKLEALSGELIGPGVVAQAKALSEQTGYLESDFLQAAMMGRTLIENYGLQTNQMMKLVQVSADLAAVSPYEDVQTTAGAMERLQSAVRGEAEASERLGLTLNDTYMKNVAMDGAYRATWTTMGEAEKAQARYKEILKQTADVMGKASDDNNIGNRVRDLNAAWVDMKTQLGESVIPAVLALADAFTALIDSIPPWVWAIIAKGANTGAAAAEGSSGQKAKEAVPNAPGTRDVFGNEMPIKQPSSGIQGQEQWGPVVKRMLLGGPMAPMTLGPIEGLWHVLENLGTGWGEWSGNGSPAAAGNQQVAIVVRDATGGGIVVVPETDGYSYAPSNV